MSDTRQEFPTTHVMVTGFAVAALLLVGGSFWPGWVLESTAQKRVADSQRAGFTKVLSPICEQNFRKQADLPAAAAALKAVDSWKRDRYLVDAKFVAPTGTPATDVAVGDKCADLLSDLVK